jgi:lysophospholipase L1-like esterase
MAIPVHVGTNVDFCGDSLTAQGWFWSTQSQVGGTNLLVDQLSPATVMARVGSVSGHVASATGSIGLVSSVTGGGQINAINQGHGQQKIGDCLTNIATWILATNPQVLVLEFGRNDVGPPNPPFTPTTLVDFRTSYDAVLDQTLAAFPSCAIVCLSIFMKDEQWGILNGSPAFNNEFDPPFADLSYTPSIIEFNQQIQQSCVAHGGTYIDLRTPALAVEVAQNIPLPGATTGPLTIDGTHPNAAGQLLISGAVLPAFVFS